MLNQLLQCFTSGNCESLMQNLPAGGGVMVTIAVFGVVTFIPVVKEKLLAWFKQSWQAILAMLSGAIVFFIDGRIATFSVALAITAICLLALNESVCSFLSRLFNKVPGVTRLPELALANFILLAGVLVYLLTYSGAWIWEVREQARFEETDNDFVVVFALPAVDTSSIVTSNRYQDDIKKLEHKLLDDLLRTISLTFNGIAAKSDILPEQEIFENYDRLKKDFPFGRAPHSSLVRNLKAYRKGTASPVDLVLVTTFRFLPQQDRVRCSFHLFELSSGLADLRKVDWSAEVTISTAEIPRASLIAGAGLALHVADNGYDIVDNDQHHLWDGLLKNFREYYNVWDVRKDERGEHWSGHAVYEKECIGKKCVAAWLKAYTTDSGLLSENDATAVDRLESQVRKLTRPLAVSLTEGTDS